MEGVVLFRVKYFEQGRCWVTVVRHLRHFVNLVQYENGVA